MSWYKGLIKSMSLCIGRRNGNTTAHKSCYIFFRVDISNTYGEISLL